tara:strand:+ start:83 stop:757 length:675 start_codon:yes stop_codon:yes gene_type:complete
MRYLQRLWINPLIFASLLFSLPVSSSPEYTLSVFEFIQEFNANSIVAGDKFMGKRIKLTNGLITSINDSIIGNEFVSVGIKPRYNYSYNSVKCNHSRNEEIIRLLRSGFYIEVTGTLKSEESGISFNNCVYSSKESVLNNDIDIKCLKCLEPSTRNVRENSNSPSMVKIKVLIDKSGKVKKIYLVKSSNNSTIDNAALRAAKRSTFYPIVRDSYLTIEYKFLFS